MFSGRHSHDQKRALIVALALLITLGGCSQRQSADEALNKALANAGQGRERVYPLAGRLTIDGQKPRFDKPPNKIVVMLHDCGNPDIPVGERPYVLADPEGRFAFHTYFDGDGVKPGKYVLTFAVLRKKGKLGLVGPDRLKNLYNDPDENAKVAELNIDHHAPGKTDYVFDLQVAGREPISNPGSKALVAIGN